MNPDSRSRNFQSFSPPVKRWLIGDREVVEEYIDGREFTVLVMAGPDPSQPPVAFTPIEFIFPPGPHFKTYDLKITQFHPECNVPCTEAGLAALEIWLKPKIRRNQENEALDQAARLVPGRPLADQEAGLLSRPSPCSRRHRPRKLLSAPVSDPVSTSACVQNYGLTRRPTRTETPGARSERCSEKPRIQRDPQGGGGL